MSNYFTFMVKQGVLSDKYVEVEGNDLVESRERMVRNFGVQWAFQYEEWEKREALEIRGYKRYALIEADGRVSYD